MQETPETTYHKMRSLHENMNACGKNTHVKGNKHVAIACTLTNGKHELWQVCTCSNVKCLIRAGVLCLAAYERANG